MPKSSLNRAETRRQKKENGFPALRLFLFKTEYTTNSIIKRRKTVRKEIWKKRATALILTAAALFAFCYLANTLSFLVFPLLGAVAVSDAIGTSFKRMKRLHPAVRRILVILMLLIVFALLLLLGVVLTEKAVRLARVAGEAAGEAIPEFAESLSDLLERAEAGLSRLMNREFHGELTGLLPQLFRNAAEALLARAPDFLGGFFSSVPHLLISLVLFLVTTYSLSCREDPLGELADRFLPEAAARRAREIRDSFLSSLRGYAKSYAILFLLTFAESLAGLWLLRADHPWGGAFLIALVDLLPIFGSGTVLVPWAVFSFLGGRAAFGAGLLALYGVISVVRQFAEPKIVGSSLGLHPVLSLVLLITGLRFFGIGGMIALPILGSCLLPAFLQKEKGPGLPERRPDPGQT